MVIPLKTVAAIIEDNNLHKLLSSFSCSYDTDIEHFLHNTALNFELLSKARTYLIFDERDILVGNNSPIIYGYVSLALKILSVPDSISNRMRKELDGLNAKIHGQRITDFPCYLIGQLSKNTNINNNPVSGNDLLQIAFDIIASASDAVGGRYMMIECRNEHKLLEFYNNNNFFEIARIPDDNIPMVQMIRKI